MIRRLDETVDSQADSTDGETVGSGVVWVIAAFLTVYLVWGSTYLAIRFAVETIPPFMMASVRFLIAGGIMYAFQFARGEAKVTFGQVVACGASGTLMLVGGNGLVCWAEQFVPSGITALIIGTSPLWIVVVGWAAFGDEVPGPKVIIGLLLGLIGVALLSRQAGHAGEATNPLAAVAILFACFFWACGSHLSKSSRMPKSLLLSVSLQMLTSGVVLLIISTCLGEPWVLDVAAVSPKSFWSLVYLIVFGAIIAYTCYGWLFRNVSPAIVSTYAYVNPIVAVILGYFLASEDVNQTTVVAGALILAGVLLVSRRKKNLMVQEEDSDVPKVLLRR